MGAGGKGKGKTRSWAPVQKPQLKRNSTRQSPYWDDRGTPPWKASNGGGMQGPPPAGVKIMKKVNWLNRQGYFGKQAVDEDALEMLGTLPEDRAMTILENLEQKAEQGDIWNPNSYVVNAVIRHSSQLKQPGPSNQGSNQTSGDLPAAVPVLKKVNWLNREGFFGKNFIDEDAIEMLGSLPVDRALSILTNIEEKANDGQIWNPNSYVVKAVVRHQTSLKNDKWEDDRRQQKGGKGKGGKGFKGTALAIRSGPSKGKGKSRY